MTDGTTNASSESKSEPLTDLFTKSDYWQAARTYERRGQLHLALRCAQRAHELSYSDRNDGDHVTSPTPQRIVYKIVNLLMYLGRSADALTMAQTLVQQNPDSAGAQYVLGSVHYRLGAFPSALEHYRAASALGGRKEPQYVRVLQQFVRLLVEQRALLPVEMVPLVLRDNSIDFDEIWVRLCPPELLQFSLEKPPEEVQAMLNEPLRAKL